MLWEWSRVGGGTVRHRCKSEITQHRFMWHRILRQSVIPLYEKKDTTCFFSWTATNEIHSPSFEDLWVWSISWRGYRRLTLESVWTSRVGGASAVTQVSTQEMAWSVTGIQILAWCWFSTSSRKKGKERQRKGNHSPSSSNWWPRTPHFPSTPISSPTTTLRTAQ